MALIICFECGKEFSDKAMSCPNCGCPTEYILSELKEKEFKEAIYKEVVEELEIKESESKDENVTNVNDSSEVIEEEYSEELNDLVQECENKGYTEVFTIPTYDNSSEFNEHTEKLRSKKMNLHKRKNEIISKFDKISQVSFQAQKSKQAPSISLKKVMIIGVAIIFLLVCISGIQAALKDRINWNEVVLGEMLPEPDSKKGYIWENSTKNLHIDIYNTSTSEYYEYISECSEETFLIEPKTEEFSYCAYNSEGYQLTITYSEYSEEMSIEIDEPIELEIIDWNFEGIGVIIPKLDSKKGKILDDGDDKFSLYVGDIDLIEFEQYVKGCSKHGFNIDSVTTDNSYEAKNSERYRIKIEYIGFSIIEITVYEPVYIVNVNVSCIENLFMNKYDVDVSIDEYTSLGTVGHGKNETFQIELPKGTHTLNCKNDIFDEDYEDYDASGKVKFEVTGDTEVSFELWCRTDSIDVELILDESKSQESDDESQSTSTEKKKLGKNEVMMPESAIMYEGDKYQDVKKELQALGFKNIQTKAVYDLGTGWLGSSSIDDVKMISIAGNTEFNEGDVFKKSDKIVIKYRKYEIDDPSIEYKKYSVAEMMNDLDDNAARAKEKYYGKFVEITGQVTTIASSASSFDLIPTDNSWEIRTVTCDAKTEAHENKIMKLSCGDVITVRGKITIANEWGYVMSIYSFK